MQITLSMFFSNFNHIRDQGFVTEREKRGTQGSKTGREGEMNTLQPEYEPSAHSAELYGQTK